MTVIQGLLVYWYMYMYVVTEFKHEFSCDVIRATACKYDQIYEKQSYTNYKYNLKYSIQD